MGLFDLIGWLVIGLVIGLLARFLVPGKDPMGFLATTLLGIAGSFLGGLISRLLFRSAPGQGFVRPGFIVSLIGAIILVLVVRRFRKV